MIKSNDIINVIEYGTREILFSQYNVKKNLIINNLELSHEQASSMSGAWDLLTYLILPRSDFIEKKLSIPSIDDEEIIQMARIQALKLVPFPHDEIITHCQIINKSEEGYSTVLLFIISEGQLAALLNPVISCGFFPDKIFINTLLFPKLISRLEKNTTGVNRFIYFNDNYVEIGFFEKQTLLYSRHIEGSFKNNDDFIKLTAVIEDSFKYIAGKYAYNCAEIPYLISKYTQADFENYNKSIRDYEYLKCDATQVFQLISDNNEPGFAIPVIERNKKKKKSRLYGLRIISVVILFLFSVIGYFISEKIVLEKRLAAIDSEIIKIKADADWAKNVNDKMSILTQHYANTDNYISAILELYKLIPDYVSLTLLNFKDYKKVVIKGVAKKGVIDIVEILEKSPYFQNVTLKYQNRLGREKGVEFSINCDLENV